jgi:hypothetical protein
MNKKEQYQSKYSDFDTLKLTARDRSFFLPQFEYLVKSDKLNTKGKSAIDLGCGFATKTYLISDFFTHITGLDFIHNIVEVNKLLNLKPHLNFVCEDVEVDQKTSEKYDIALAFGLSTINQKNIDDYIKQVSIIQNKYLKQEGVIVIWSFTDFSGKANSGWYNHTNKELSELKKRLETTISNTATIIYPYREMGWFLGFNIKTLKRIFRFFQKKQYYFLIIQ